MLFNFSRRQGDFGVFNNRRENEGQKKQVTKAIDLPVKFPIKAKDLNMLMPCNGTPFSEFAFGADAEKKPELQTHLLFPMTVHRRPEHIRLTFFLGKKDSLVFEECKVKDPVVEYTQEDGLVCRCKFQIHPGEELQTISDEVEARTVSFACKAVQPEIFDPNPPADEATGTQQPDLLGGGSGDEDEDEDDDD